MALLAPVVNDLFTINTGTSPIGSVVSFQYAFAKHDPFPVILVANFKPPNLVEGLNLHYMAFPVFRELLKTHGDNPFFRYEMIKSQPLVKFAYRSYKMNGIKRAKKINYKAIIQAMSIMREYSPQEIEAIKNAVDQTVLNRQSEILNELMGNIVARATQAPGQSQVPGQVAPAAPTRALGMVPTAPVAPEAPTTG